MIHQPVSVVSVFAECLAGRLACGNQRRHTGSGSAFDALYTYTFTLPYVTLDADNVNNSSKVTDGAAVVRELATWSDAVTETRRRDKGSHGDTTAQHQSPDR